MWGSVFLLKGFSPLRKWTFGAGYNHPAVVLKPLFKLGPVHHLITLSRNGKMFCGLVFTSRLNAVVRSQNK